MDDEITLEELETRYKIIDQEIDDCEDLQLLEQLKGRQKELMLLIVHLQQKMLKKLKPTNTQTDEK